MQLLLKCHDVFGVERGPKLPTSLASNTKLEFRLRAIRASDCPVQLAPSVIDTQGRIVRYAVSAAIESWIPHEGYSDRPRIDMVVEQHEDREIGTVAVCDTNTARRTKIVLAMNRLDRPETKPIQLRVTIDTAQKPIITDEVATTLGLLRTGQTTQHINGIDAILDRVVSPEAHERLRDHIVTLVSRRADRFLKALARTNGFVAGREEDYLADYRVKLLERWEQARVITGHEIRVAAIETLRNMIRDKVRRARARPQAVDGDAVEHATDSGRYAIDQAARIDAPHDLGLRLADAWKSLQHRKNFKRWSRCLAVARRDGDKASALKMAQAVGPEHNAAGAREISIVFSQLKSEALTEWAVALVRNPMLYLDVVPELAAEVLALESRAAKSRIAQIRAALAGLLSTIPEDAFHVAD